MKTLFVVKKIETDYDHYLCNDGNLIRQTPTVSTLQLNKIKCFNTEEEAYEYIQVHSVRGFLTIVKVYIK